MSMKFHFHKYYKIKKKVKKATNLYALFEKKNLLFIFNKKKINLSRTYIFIFIQPFLFQPNPSVIALFFLQKIIIS